MALPVPLQPDTVGTGHVEVPRKEQASIHNRKQKNKDNLLKLNTFAPKIIQNLDNVQIY